MRKEVTETKAGRRYSGLKASERTSVRREALLEAGLQLFGTAGYQSTSVKQVCTEAGLSERYFYESFKDRQRLLLGVYEELVDGMRADTFEAIAAATGDDVAVRALGAFVGYLTADPRRARVVLIEVMGVGPLLETRRHDVMREFADVINAVWLDATTGGTERMRQLVATALVGAVAHLLVDWLLGGHDDTSDELVAVCVTLAYAARQQLTDHAV
ncbi:TetR/AcrR family transcriptional regulator [Antrihabitans cavernicola]|uniref:TetR/AcrR family transcriptional regulator n=1 Tax=Antrihabitans cavernicola TaxID=2495913 RepID=A0A5A7S6H3_9NOCA|nr:TetR/AcrR family transcriptional regulator [Spelaeibacter cavernicola]KAA0019449.1 TetR/AcrR family transcriptional regulator [Spelaeibacter cavernicola]